MLLLFLSLNLWAATPELHYLVPTKHLTPDNPIYKEVKPILKDSKLSLVKLSEEQSVKLSGYLHEKTGACGGFQVVEDELKETVGLLNISSLSQIKPQARYKYPKSIGFKSQSQSVFQVLSQRQYQERLNEVTSFSNRYANSPEGVRFSNHLVSFAKNIAQRNNRKDIEVTQQQVNNYKQKNVIIRVKGKNSQLPAIVIGAHMDTINCPGGWCTNPAAPNQGADDDGSGTATVMEVYRGIVESQLKFDRDIYFMFYAAEELGLHGSKAIARDFKRTNKQVYAALQLDMTAFDSPKNNKTFYLTRDYTNNELTNYFRGLASEYLGVPQNQIGDMECGYACSDHASWHGQGFPSVFPAEEPFQHMNKNIHSKHDTKVHLNFEKAFKFVKMSTAFVVELARPL